MSVHSASNAPSPGGPPLERRNGTDPPARTSRSWSPLGRQRLTGRGGRRQSPAGLRAEHQLDHLGPAWQVVEWPDPQVATGDEAGFLAIGPGGVFAVTVVDHGRRRVMVAGDVVQIQGRRPPYVATARRRAKRTREALSAAVGTKVPVVPVLAFVGSGAISAQGQPTGCVAVAHRELDRVLLASGNKISAATARKLADVANHPATWSDQYRRYSDGQTASDNRAARR